MPRVPARSTQAQPRTPPKLNLEFRLKFLVLGVAILSFLGFTEATYFVGGGGILYGFLPIDDTTKSEPTGFSLIIGFVTSSFVFSFGFNKGLID